MAKQITIEEAQIEEIIIRPNDSTPVTVSYKLLDDDGKMVTVKRITIPKNEITNSMAEMATKLLTSISTEEGL
jgi:hypothetical protein